MADPRVERCKCEGKYPHWRIIYADGSVSLPFFSLSSLGVGKVLRGMRKKDHNIVCLQLQKLQEELVAGMEPISKIIFLSNMQYAVMYYDLHWLCTEHFTEKQKIKWETAAVNMWGGDPEIFCYGRKSE